LLALDVEGEKMISNYINFIDSKDIREFNQNTYFFPAELAVIVTTSNHTTLEDKINAIKQLLKEYGPELNDISRLSNGGCLKLNPEIGFEGELKNHLAALEDAFCNKGENWFGKTLYIASFMEIDFNIRYSHPWDNNAYFESFDAAYSYLVKEKEEYLSDDDLKDVRTSACIKVLDLTDPEKQHDFGLFLFDNKMQLCDVCVPKCIYDFEFDAAFYIHVPSPFSKGTLVKWNSTFYKPEYGVVCNDPITREEDRALEYGDGSDIIESIDMYIPSRIYEDEGYWSWDHLPYLELEKCEPEDVPEELQPLLSWREGLVSGDI
jgi:hypothetical protein